MKKTKPMNEEDELQALKNLKSLVGNRAYKALLNGRPLQIWRQTSPHNWFIETKRKGNFLWHSDDYTPRYVPDLRIFRKLKDSDEKVIQYWGADSGMPQLSSYILKDHLRIKE